MNNLGLKSTSHNIHSGTYCAHHLINPCDCDDSPNVNNGFSVNKPTELICITGHPILGQDDGKGHDISTPHFSQNLMPLCKTNEKIENFSNGVVLTFQISQESDGLRRHVGHPRNYKNYQKYKRRNSVSAINNSKSTTITQHYYPEGGWGYVVLIIAVICHALMCGLQLSGSIIIWGVTKTFKGTDPVSVNTISAGFTVASSFAISLFFSPIFVSICQRKSTRLAAIFGALVASLGCLFASFASQFHQIFLSYGIIFGIGAGLTKDASCLMVGQYFKKKRKFVEIILVSSSGFGIILMTMMIYLSIRTFGWRLGVELITLALFLTFFLGSCYRSASLYHPQRRAVLHIKEQQRKLKGERCNGESSFLDFSSLKRKSIKILLFSSAVTAFGIYSPVFIMIIEQDVDIQKSELNKIVTELSPVIFNIALGISWVLGSSFFGFIAIQKNEECRVSMQYLCQIGSTICGISILALASLEGFKICLIFTCVYGFSLGGYNYALKMYTHEKVGAKVFFQTWAFIQCSQAMPIVLGVPLTGYLNIRVGWQSGYYLSAICVILGSASLFLIDILKGRRVERKIQDCSIQM